MADVVIVGDGPGGLSAALFLAKNEKDVVVLGQNKTFMHTALLYNYLGIPEIPGPKFQEVAREQARKFGAKIIDTEVSDIKKGASGFVVSTTDGATHQGKYLILATGTEHDLVEKLGLEKDEDGGVVTAREGNTNIENLYVIGWLTRPQRIQAIISAGDGAAAALSILSAEAGKDIHDFDVLKEEK